MTTYIIPRPAEMDEVKRLAMSMYDDMYNAFSVVDDGMMLVRIGIESPVAWEVSQTVQHLLVQHLLSEQLEKTLD